MFVGKDEGTHQSSEDSLRAMGSSIQKGGKKWFALWFDSLFARSVGYKDVVISRKRFAVVHLQNPALLARIIHVPLSNTPRRLTDISLSLQCLDKFAIMHYLDIVS